VQDLFTVVAAVIGTACIAFAVGYWAASRTPYPPDQVEETRSNEEEE